MSLYLELNPFQPITFFALVLLMSCNENLAKLSGIGTLVLTALLMIKETHRHYVTEICHDVLHLQNETIQEGPPTSSQEKKVTEHHLTS